MVVLAGGLCAIGVDRFVLRPDGGLSSAAASVASSVEAAISPQPAKAASKEVIDRTSAAIADRLERLPVEAVTVSRDAFAEPWTTAEKQAAPIAAAAAPAPAEKKCPWTLTSVSTLNGRLTAVLNGEIVLTIGSRTNDQVELLSAVSNGPNSKATVRDIASAVEYTLILGPVRSDAKH